jgi:hypothetical protein
VHRVVGLLLAVVTVTAPADRANAQPVPRANGEALRALVARASQNNRLPDDLISYRATVESEIAVILRREEGTEAVAALEQVASTLRWNRTGAYEQRVNGYRTQQLGANVSMLSVFRTGWLNPSLYGNRLRFRRQAPADTGRRGRAAPSAPGARRDGADTLPAVHPLATDRESYYDYSGGDTVVTMQAGTRTIHIAQVRVQPKRTLTQDVVLFDGEMQLDADRAQLVRLRGHFVRVNGPRRGLAGALTDAVGYIEYENGERAGRYWLPARQRLELQITAPVIGDARAVVRIVSRFADMQVNDTVLTAETLAIADSLRLRARRRLTYAPTDSLARFGDWRATLGTITAGMHADDFEDIAPDRWRITGPPRLDFAAPRAADVFHFNRVEGAYTGAGLKWSLRDAAPGVIVRANAGYAWAEQTVRGRLLVERTRGPWTLEARGGRSMDITNDFRVPFDSGSTFGALFGSLDPYDYVSRNTTALGVVRRLGARAAIVRAEVGYGDDRWRPSQYVRGPFGGDAYRENRGVAEGSYLRTAALLEWHPDLAAEFTKPGVGARLSYERGDGTLSWQRVEARLSGRKPLGPIVALARGDVGLVTGARIPSQQLFELGRFQNLPGYDDKEFAGSRAAAVRASLQYTTPFLRNPIRVGRNLLLPAIAPGLSVGVQSGWTDAPSPAARAAIDGLAMTDPTMLAQWAPVSRPTERIRASVTAGFRFFGNGLFLGATRQVDQAAPWKALLGFGQQW